MTISQSQVVVTVPLVLAITEFVLRNSVLSVVTPSFTFVLVHGHGHYLDFFYGYLVHKTLCLSRMLVLPTFGKSLLKCYHIATSFVDKIQLCKLDVQESSSLCLCSPAALIMQDITAAI